MDEQTPTPAEPCCSTAKCNGAAIAAIVISLIALTAVVVFGILMQSSLNDINDSIEGIKNGSTKSTSDIYNVTWYQDQHLGGVCIDSANSDSLSALYPQGLTDHLCFSDATVNLLPEIDFETRGTAKLRLANVVESIPGGPGATYIVDVIEVFDFTVDEVEDEEEEELEYLAMPDNFVVKDFSFNASLLDWNYTETYYDRDDFTVYNFYNVEDDEKVASLNCGGFGHGLQGYDWEKDERVIEIGENTYTIEFWAAPDNTNESSYWVFIFMTKEKGPDNDSYGCKVEKRGANEQELEILEQIYESVDVITK